MSNFQKHMASKVPFGTSAARERAQAVAEINIIIRDGLN